MQNLLRDTLLQLYKDSPEITEVLLKCDFTKLNRKFTEEVFSRISKEEFEYIDGILHSDAYMRYRDAVDGAAFACTQELANLISFVVEDGGSVH